MAIMEIEFKDTQKDGLPETNHPLGIFVLIQTPNFRELQFFRSYSLFFTDLKGEVLNRNSPVNDFSKIVWNFAFPLNGIKIQNISLWAYGNFKLHDDSPNFPDVLNPSRDINGVPFLTQSNLIFEEYAKTLKKIVIAQNGYIRKEDVPILNLWLNIIHKSKIKLDADQMKHIHIINSTILSSKKMKKEDRDFLEFVILKKVL